MPALLEYCFLADDVTSQIRMLTQIRMPMWIRMPRCPCGYWALSNTGLSWTTEYVKTRQDRR